MTTISSNYNDFGKQLCKILGLNGGKTRTITISCLPNDVVLVTVEQYLQDTEADKLIPVLKEYRLIPDKPITKDSLTVEEIKQEISEYEETLLAKYKNCKHIRINDGICMVDDPDFGIFECSASCNAFEEKE